MLDLEGTLYTRAGVIPGARETVAALRKCTAGIRFLTNTDSRADGSLLAELHELDLDVAEHELFTPVTAAAKLVSAVPGARAFVIGTSEVTEQLADTLQLAADPTAATHVIVGDCQSSLSYSLLNDAFQALSNGAELIALQHGRYFLSGGRAQLDTGAVVAALEYATDRTAVVVGKPSVHFLDAAVRSFPGTPAPEDVWVVGDDAATDIAMGQHYGATTVQVRTGKFDPAHQTAYATHIIDSITGLLALLRK